MSNTPECPECGAPGSSKGFKSEVIWIPTCQCGKGLFPEKPKMVIIKKEPVLKKRTPNDKDSAIRSDRGGTV